MYLCHQPGSVFRTEGTSNFPTLLIMPLPAHRAQFYNVHTPQHINPLAPIPAGCCGRRHIVLRPVSAPKAPLLTMANEEREGAQFRFIGHIRFGEGRASGVSVPFHRPPSHALPGFESRRISGLMRLNISSGGVPPRARP